MPRFGMLENCGFLLGSHWDIIMFIIQLLSYRISHHINQLMHDFVYQPIKPSWDIGVLVLKRWTSRHPNDIQDQAEKKPNQIPRWVDFSTQKQWHVLSELYKTPTITCRMSDTHTHTLCTYPFSKLFLVFLTLIILFFVSPQQVLEVPGLLESYPNYDINLMRRIQTDMDRQVDKKNGNRNAK